MAIVITLNQKGARLETVDALVKKALIEKYPDAHISVTRHEPPESRADRFSEAQSSVSDGKSEMESLRDELQEWLDNLPENLQSGSKADELQTAIDELEEVINQCEEVEGASVEFPSMF